VNVLLDAPLVRSIALDNEFDIVFPENLLFEEPVFTFTLGNSIIVYLVLMRL
jgi:hypothetical protein